MQNSGILLRLYFLLSLASALTACTGQGEPLLFSFPTDTPASLSAVADDTNITINWDSVESANSYTLFRYSNANCGSLPDNYSDCDSAYRWHKITTTSASDPHLLNDTAYYYRIMAHSSEGNSELSEQVSARTAAAVPPSNPQNLQWQLVGEDSVELTWDLSSEVDYYVVYRVTDIYAPGCFVPDAISFCGDDEEIAQSAHIVDAATWTDDELTPGQGYYYVLLAHNVYGPSSSNSDLVLTKPSAPTMTRAELSNSGFRLEWTSELGASSYELFRYTESGCLSDGNIDTFSIDCPGSLRVSELDSPSYLDALTDVNAQNAYYRVRSANSSGYSSLSAELPQSLTLAAPDEFNLSSLSSGTANYLQWSPVLLADSYTLYRYQDGTCFLAPDQCDDSVAFVIDGSAQSYTDLNPNPGTQHYYSLRGTNSWYLGDLTMPVDVTTAPAAATNIVATAGDGAIELTWDEHSNSDVTVYTIYRDICDPESSTCIYVPSVVGEFEVGSRSDGANSFSDTGLSNAERYYYYISASAGDWDVDSSSISATTNPKAFTNLTAAAVSSQSIALYWDNPEDNKDDGNNRVYVYPCDPSAAGCTPEIHELGTGRLQTHEIENLAAGTRYYFKIALYTDSLEVNSSIADSYTDVSAPTNITHTSEANGSVVVAWESANGADTAYSLEVAICASNSCSWDSSLAASTSGNSLTLDSLYPGSAYEVRVIASVDSYSATSGTATIYTYPVAPSVTEDQFTIPEITQYSATLNWDTSINGDSSKYIPIRYTCDLAAGESCSGLPLVTFASTTSAYTDDELSAGSEYSYEIRVLNDSLDVYSESLSIITTPSEITSISTTPGDRNISLSWVNANTTEQNYTVYQSERDCSAAEQLANDTSACGATTVIESEIASATFTSLLPSTLYYYRIVAQNIANGLSSTSDSVTGSTWPEAPTDVNWTSTGADITVTWDVGDNGDVATWKIYRYPCDPESSSCFDDPHTVELDYANSSYSDSDGLTRPQEYYYQVSAIASAKEFFSASTIAMLSPNSAADLILSAGAENSEGDDDTAAKLRPYVELNWSRNDNVIETNHTIYRQQCDISQNCVSYQFDSYSDAETYSVINAYDTKDVDGYSDDARKLAPATTYYYIIGATNTMSTGRVVETLSSASVITHPAVAQDLGADGISTSSAEVNWSAGENGSESTYSVSSYHCLDASSANCSALDVVDNLESPGTTITGLDPASYYAFAVSSHAGANSIASDWLTGIATQPVAITDLSFSTSEQDGSATLATSWNSVNGEAAVYSRYLYLCTSSSTCSLQTETEGALGTDYTVTDTAYTWSDTGLTLGRLYEVAIAVESDDVELKSTALRFTTLPDLPRSLTATTLSTNSIELQWSDANNNSLTVDTSYQIYAFRNPCTAEQLAADIDDTSNNDCSIAEVGSIAKAGTTVIESHTFTGLASGNTYHFAVSASNVSGTSWVADSDQVQATTGTSGVSGVSATSITSTGFEVSVSAVVEEPNAIYSVYLAECADLSNCSAYGVTELASGTFTHTYTGLTPGQYYSVIASASANGSESNSSATSVITLPEAVTDLTATAQSSSNVIDINFTSANGSAATYQAYRYNCGYDLSSCTSVGIEATIAIDDSNYTDANASITPATYYSYTVGVTADGQEVNASTATPALTAPEVLDISNLPIVGENNISVDYAAPIGALDAYYLVLSEQNCTSEELSTSDVNCGTIATSGINATSALFENLTANKTYYLRSVVSNATATVYSEATALLTLPVTPTSLSATTQGANSIALSWTDAADEFTSGVSYQAYAFAQVCTAEQLAADLDDDSIDDCGIAETGDATTRSYTFASLASGTTYNFAVRANNASGSSWVADAEQATATTTSSGVSVAINNIASTSFDVNLSATSEPSTTYSVYLAECSAASTCSAYAKTELNTGVFDQSYSGLTPGQHYSVIASATAAGIESNSTTTSVVTSPEAVSDLTATPQTSDSAIDINYTTTNGSAATYTAYRYNCGIDASCASASIENTIDITTDINYTDTALTPANYYSYTVGVNADGQEVNASTNTALTAPAELIIDTNTITVGETEISVAYSAPSGALDYYRFLLSESNCTDEQISNSDTTNCGTISTSADSATSSPVLFDNLTANTTYYLRSVVSNATATIYSTTTDLLTLPVTATGLTATTESSSSIKLEWSASGGNDEAYAFTGTCDASALAADIDDTTSDACGIVGSKVTSAGTHTFTGLASGTTYNFVVRANNASGDSWSAQAQATTQTSGIDAISTANVVSTGFDVSITAAATEPDTTYSVHLAECDATPTCDIYTATELTSGVFDYSYTNLIPAQHYSVIASASAGGVESNSSAKAVTTLPVAVTDLTAEGQASGIIIDINYTTANGSATTYTAYRYNCGTDPDLASCTSLDNTITISDSNHSDSDGLDPATYYSYTVGVMADGKEENLSTTTPALTAPAVLDISSATVVEDQDNLAVDYSTATTPSGVVESYYLVLSAADCSGEDITSNDTTNCVSIETSEANKTTSISFDTLTANTTYYLRSAVKNATATIYSASTAYTTLPATPTLTLVGAHESLEASLSSSSTANTSFTLHLSQVICGDYSVSGNCTIDHSIDWLDHATTLTLDNSNTASGYFTDGATYFAAIEANNGSGSSYSAEANATTTLSELTNISATGGDQNITLDWDVTTGAVNYHARVYGESCGEDNFTSGQDSSGGALTIAGCNGTTLHAVNVAHPTNSATVSSLTEGSTYYYRIGASSSDGSTFWSEENNTDTLPAAVSSAKVGEPATASAEVNWTNSTSSAITRYDLYSFTGTSCDDADLLTLASSIGETNGSIAGNAECPEFNYVYDATSGVTVTGLATSTIYYFRIATVNRAGSVFDNDSLSLTTTSALSDPLAPEQWHLDNNGSNTAFASDVGVAGMDINYTGVPAGITGDGVRVNVIDSGLEMQHPDLLANILPDGSYDFVGRDNDPTNTTDTGGDHGTSVAGIIAAAANGVGGVGVASRAILQGFNYLESAYVSNFVASVGGDDKLADTAIFNQSFGLTSSSMQSDSRYGPDQLDALSCFASGGEFDSTSACTGALRSGLGALYVKSAGNSFTNAGDDDWCRIDDINLSCYNTNMDSARTYPYQIVVGALNAYGLKSSYSTAGSSIWLAAPGGEYGMSYEHVYAKIDEQFPNLVGYKDSFPAVYWQPAMITTDQVGCERGNSTDEVTFFSGTDPVTINPLQDDRVLDPNCEYTATFNGTSSAAPVVSGVIALMLEANPNLTWRDVKHILASTARQVDSSIATHSVPLMLCASDCSDDQYTASSSTFLARAAWATNAAGYSYHNWYGFGLVDAGAAVTMAQSYSPELGEWNMTSVELSSINTDIPDADGSAASATFTVGVDANLTIEAAQLDLQITHHYLGALAIVLKSPSGTRSVLLTPYSQYGDEDDFDSTLISNAFYGESTVGDWTLEVYDLIADQNSVSLGTLDSATLRIYGHLKN